MVRRGRAGLAFALLLTASFLPFLAEVGTSATVPYTLFGRSSVPNGWGFTAGGETNPGPMLWANEGDTVDLTLTREDAGTHWWFLDYPPGGWSAGEPRSPDFFVNTPYSFVADRPGTFLYHCGIHFSSMVGTFTINATRPAVLISQPTGSQTWTGGLTHDVVWTMTDPQSPDTSLVAYLNYTSSAGNGVIAGGVTGNPNPQIEPWSVPSVSVGDMRVNITVIDPDGNRGYAEALVPNVDSTAPTVGPIVPANGEPAAPITTSLQIPFSEAMNQTATVGAVSLQELPSWNLVPLGSPSWAGNTLTLQPGVTLTAGVLHQVNITPAAKDVSEPGNPLAAPFTSQFTTADLPPFVTSITMPDGTRRWTGGTSHDVIWTMNDLESPLASLSAFLNYTSSAGNGAIAPPVSGSANPHTQSWTVPAIDANDVRVNITVIDPNGGKGYGEALVDTIDSTPPDVAGVFPLPGSTGVPLSTTIDITFTEAMNPSTAEAAVSLFPSASLAVQGWTGNTLTLLPSGLVSLTMYQINVTVAATDASEPGIALASPFMSTFTTEDLPPNLLLLAPAGGERWTGGSLHAVNWTPSDPDTALASLTVDLGYSLTGAAPWTSIPPTVPAVPSSFSWTVPAVDSNTVAVNATISDGTSTVTAISPLFAIDSTPPSVTTTSPANGASNVPLNALVTVLFDEVMDASAAPASALFGLQDLSTLAWVQGTLNWGGGNLDFTFSPSALLAANTEYRGHVNSSARDASSPGLNLPVPYTWTFNTSAVVDLTPPSITNVSALPDPAAVNEVVTFLADVTDPGSGVASVRIVVLLGVTEVANTTMAVIAGVTYGHAQGFATPGAYTFTITARDGAGNSGTFGGALAVEDRSPPQLTVTVLPDPAPFGAVVNITAVITDDVGVVSARLLVTLAAVEVVNTTMAFVGGDVWSHAQAYAPGTHALSVTAADAAGNTATAAGTFTVLLPPPPQVSGLQASPNPVEFPASVTLSGVVNASLAFLVGVWIDVPAVSNDTATLVGPGNRFSKVPVLVPAPGTYSFTVSALDAWGQWGSASGTFDGVDTTPPAVSNFLPRSVPQANRTTAYEVNVTDNWGVASVVLVVGTVAVNFTGGPVYAGNLSLPLGTHAGTVTATDRAGLTTDLVVTLLVADTEPPVINHTGVASMPIFQAIALTVMLTDNDRITAASISWTDVRATSGTSPLPGAGTHTVTLPPQLAAGTVTYSFTATDASGNVANLPGLTLAVTGAPPVPALYGTLEDGWGLGPANITNPGPTLLVSEGDTLSVTVVGYDGAFHYLYVDLNGNGRPDPGEPRSDEVFGSFRVLNITAPAGVYAYYCGNHQTEMHGTLRVTAMGDGGGEKPGMPGWVVPLIVLFILVGVPLLVLLFRRARSRKEEEPAEPSGGGEGADATDTATVPTEEPPQDEEEES